MTLNFFRLCFLTLPVRPPAVIHITVRAPMQTDVFQDFINTRNTLKIRHAIQTGLLATFQTTYIWTSNRRKPQSAHNILDLFSFADRGTRMFLNLSLSQVLLFRILAESYLSCQLTHKHSYKYAFTPSSLALNRMSGVPSFQRLTSSHTAMLIQCASGHFPSPAVQRRLSHPLWIHATQNYETLLWNSQHGSH